MLPLSRPIFAATTERIVSDPGSGLAIGGFDPVAYFTDAAPRLGSSDFELSFAGVVWRFRNEGNRAAFNRRGSAATIRSRWRAAPAPPPRRNMGDRRGPLHLFYSAQAREMFAGAPGPAIGAAERVWPAVQRTLSS